jgi:pimeloyl-ACP methyl ester carboxylesterase
MTLPVLDRVAVEWRGATFSLPYLFRSGPGPAILFVHGLGAAKEIFHSAFLSRALAECTLVTFDLPGSGLAEFAEGLDVSGLADLTQALADRLLPGPYFFAGSSMGGLIALLQMRRHGFDRIQGFMNLEGNLCPEDCMYSRRVIPHSLEVFADFVYAQIIDDMRASPHTGDRIVAENVAMNVDVRAYHAYSAETVRESDSGRLLDEFLALPMPRLFLYGEANRALSYLPRLRDSDVEVREIQRSGHFFFHDNPIATFDAIGEFVHRHARR